MKCYSIIFPHKIKRNERKKKAQNLARGGCLRNVLQFLINEWFLIVDIISLEYQKKNLFNLASGEYLMLYIFLLGG
jgi:hypothetical protein